MQGNSNSILANAQWSKYQTLAKYMPQAKKQAANPVPPVSVNVNPSTSSSVTVTAPSQSAEDNKTTESQVQQDQPQIPPVKDTANDTMNLLDQLINQQLEQKVDSKSKQATNTSPVYTQQKEKLLATDQLQVDRTAETPVIEEEAEQTVVEAVPVAEQLKQQEQALKNEINEAKEISEIGAEIQEIEEAQEKQEQAQTQDTINNLASAATAATVANNKPVVILPLTEKKAVEAKSKNSKYSLRWLLEWCQKISKIFIGGVVYKEEVTEN